MGKRLGKIEYMEEKFGLRRQCIGFVS